MDDFSLEVLKVNYFWVERFKAGRYWKSEVQERGSSKLKEHRAKGCPEAQELNFSKLHRSLELQRPEFHVVAHSLYELDYVTVSPLSFRSLMQVTGRVN